MGKKGPWSQGLQYRRHHSPTWSLLCLQMAQELGISEKSPDYRNPFKTDHSEVRWQHCWHILRGSTSTLWLQAAGWAGEGNGWLGGEQPKTPSMEEAYPKHVRQIPQLGCGWFGCPVPSALSCGHLSHGSIGSLFTWCCIQPQVSWHCRTGMVASVALGGCCLSGTAGSSPC